MLPTKLQTPRLILRDYEPFDLMDIQKYASDPEVVEYMEWGPNTLEDTSRFLADVLKQGRKMPRMNYEMVILEKESNKAIGAVSLRVQSLEHKQADMGYVLNRNYWGTGIMTEAGKAMLEFAFNKLELHRVWAYARTENAASIKVLQKIGMKQEGLLREHLFYKGTWWSSYLYSCLKMDF